MGYVETGSIRTKIVQVTPAMAKEWLSKNPKNRKLSLPLARQYASDMKHGEWKLTHQGIAFDKNGNLLDGQHRLMGIVIADVTIPMLVVTYTELASAMKVPIDLQKKRRLYEILSIDRCILEPIIFLLRELTSGINGNNGRRIETEVLDFVDRHPALPEWIRENVSGACRKVVSAAPIRAATILAYLSGNDWTEQYDNLVNLRFDDPMIEKSTIALYRKLMKYEGSTTGLNFRRDAFGAVYAVATSDKDVLYFSDKIIDNAWEKAKQDLAKYDTI